MQIIVTFDLKNATEEQYDAVYKDLLDLGLSRLTPKERLRLPWSTVLGEISGGDGMSAKAIRDALIATIEKASHCKVERICVGVVSDWASFGAPDHILSLKELLQELVHQ